MKWIVSLLTACVLLLSACKTTAPTPMLMGSLADQDNEVVALYAACSEGDSYVVSKEGCDPDLLKEKVDSTMDFAVIFISGDIKQPQGYDVYLATAMILFRISQGNEDSYSRAEMIARQFFEIQKASSGKSLTPARFYWAAMSAGHSSWQWRYDRLALGPDRKTDLLLCLMEAKIALTDNTGWLTPPREIMLNSSVGGGYIGTLTMITNSIQ